MTAVRTHESGLSVRVLPAGEVGAAIVVLPVSWQRDSLPRSG